MEKQEFLAMVLADAIQLKERSTAEEKEDLVDVEPSHSYRCILGRMTGHFNSTRAKEMLNKTIYQNTVTRNQLFEKHGKTAVQMGDVFNGIGNFNFTDLYLEVLTTDNMGNQPFAPLEMFIQFKDANMGELIEFIKGERETFVPRMNE